MARTSASEDVGGWGADLGFSAKAFAKEVLQQFREDEVTGLAQRVAYNLIFAIPPMLVLVVAIAGLLNNVFDVPVVDNLRTLISNHAPGSVQDVLTQLIDNAVAKAGAGAISFGLIISLALAIYGAAGGVGALILAFDRTYDVADSRSFIKRYALQIGLTLLLGTGMVLAFVALLFGRRTGTWIANLVGLGSLFSTVWNIVLWPAAVVLVIVMLGLLYYWGPDVAQTFRWVWPGAIVAGLLWIIAIFGFRVYLMFGNPGSAYGALGSAIVFLFFLYISCAIIVAGAEVNAVLQKHYDRKLIADLARRGPVARQRPLEPVRRRAERLGLLPETGRQSAEPESERRPVRAAALRQRSRRRSTAAQGATQSPPVATEQRPVGKASWAAGLAALGIVVGVAGDALFGKKQKDQ